MTEPPHASLVTPHPQSSSTCPHGLLRRRRVISARSLCLCLCVAGAQWALELREVRAEHAGLYRCVASNRFGNASCTRRLLVRERATTRTTSTALPHAATSAIEYTSREHSALGSSAAPPAAPEAGTR